MKIQVKTIPKAKKESVEEKNGIFVVRVNAVPERGKANEESASLFFTYWVKIKSKGVGNVKTNFLLDHITNLLYNENRA